MTPRARFPKSAGGWKAARCMRWSTTPRFRRRPKVASGSARSTKSQRSSTCCAPRRVLTSTAPRSTSTAASTFKVFATVPFFRPTPKRMKDRPHTIGRFASTAPLYEALRPPYPPEFFRTVARKLGFGRQHALIDLGTGPGLLALGFAPYVGRIVGVDPEPAMLAAAREAAGRASQAFTLIE